MIIACGLWCVLPVLAAEEVPLVFESVVQAGVAGPVVRAFSLPEPAVRDVVLPRASHEAVNRLPIPELPLRKTVSKSVQPAVVEPVKLPAKTVAAVASPATPKPSVKPVATASVKSLSVPAAKPVAVPAATAKPVVSVKPALKPVIAEPASISMVSYESKPAAVSAQSAGNRLTMDASVGQIVSIVFPGKGWLYLGTGTAGDGVVFMQNTQQPEGERFSFRPERSGTRLLQFQKQDLSHGTLERREVLLVISGNTVPATTGVQSKLLSDEKKIDPAPPVSGMVKSTEANPVQANFSEKTTALPQGPEDLFALAIQKESQGFSSESIALYDKVLKEFPGFVSADQVLFRYARLLEKWQDNNRLKQAYDCYIRLQKEFPYSAHADEARQRVRWLDRNFFRIQ